MDQNGTTSCVRVEYPNWLLRLAPCGEDESWEQLFDINYHPLLGQLRVTYKHGDELHVKCLTQVTNVTPVHHREQMAQVMDCSDSKYQLWRWQYHFDFTYKF